MSGDAPPNSEPSRSSIFISYKREELAYAERLRLYLENAGYSVWWDQKLQTGGTWASELDRQLTLAGCVIVLWSWRAVRSPWVRHEASIAMGRGTYLPVAIEDMAVPDPFGHIHATSLVGWDGKQEHQGFRSLLDSLEGLLEQAPTQNVVTRPGTRNDTLPWPKRVPRNIVHSAGLWLRNNLATLIAALALFTLAFLVYVTLNTVGQLDHQVRTVDAALKNLSSSVAALDSSSARLAELAQDSLAKQEKQLEEGRAVAAELKGVATTISSSARDTSALLEDSLKRIDGFEIVVRMRLDPAGLVDNERHPFLKPVLDERWRQEFGESGSAGGREVVYQALKATDPIIVALKNHDEEIRNQVFRDWRFTVVAQRNPEQPPETPPDASAARPKKASRAIRLRPGQEVIGETFDKQEGLSSFRCWEARLTSNPSEKMILDYSLSYRITTRPASGFRTYEDFRGAAVSLRIAGDFRLLAPAAVFFVMDVVGDGRLLEESVRAEPPFEGLWSATISVPVDYPATKQRKR